MEKKISSEEYQKLLEEYFKEVGPNPGSGMFSSWGWHLKREQEFKEKLKSENIVVDD